MFEEIGKEVLITQEMISNFSKLTDNTQWIHGTDAKGGPYGGQIAHGLLLVSLIPSLLPYDGPLPKHNVRIIRGIDTLRLPSPMYPNELVHARTRRLRDYPAQSGKGVIIEREVEVWSKAATKPAVTCVLKLQYF